MDSNKDPIELMRECLKYEHPLDLLREKFGIELKSGWQLACLDKFADEIEAQYIKLPVDADGVPIRPGDEIESEYMKGRKRVANVGEHDVYAHGGGEGGFFIAAVCRHVKPDTVESLLGELLIDAGCIHHSDGSCEMGLTREQIAEYAERIREAVEGTKVGLVNTEGLLWVERSGYDGLVDAKDERDRLRAEVMKLGEQLDRLRNDRGLA